MIVPKRYEVQLHVEDESRDFQILSNETKDDVGVFYNKFFSCLGAIQSGDYSFYEQSAQPSVISTFTPSISSIPSHIPNTIPSISPTRSFSSRPSKSPVSTEIDSSIPSHIPTTIPSISPTRSFSSRPSSKRPISTEIDSSIPSHIPTTIPSISPTRSFSSRPSSKRSISTEIDSSIPSHVPTAIPSISPTRSFSSRPSSKTPSQVQSRSTIVIKDADSQSNDEYNYRQTELRSLLDVEFHQRHVGMTQSKTIPKFADQMTTEVEAHEAMYKLLSGDDEIISTCFSDIKYGIREQNILQEEATTNVYVYINETQHYRLNLTFPYMKVTATNGSMPRAVPEEEFLSSGLVFAYVIASAFGICLALACILYVGRIVFGKKTNMRNPDDFSRSIIDSDIEKSGGDEYSTANNSMIAEGDSQSMMADFLRRETSISSERTVKR